METFVATHDKTLISEFRDVRDHEPHSIPFSLFMERVRGSLYKEHTLNYRRLAADEATRTEAQRVKGRTPCVVMAGECRGGHAVKDLAGYSGLLCIDLDHTDGRTDEVMRRAASLPWVVAAFRSISGNGVKVVACVNGDDMRGRYPALYAAVGRAVTACVEHPYDEKCKILTQPCYYSWDPDAYYNPRAEAFGFTPEAVPGAEEADTRPAAVGAPVPASVPSPAAGPGAGFLEQFVSDFEHRHPFARGQRNDIALKLGQQARRKGFSQSELERLMQMFCYRHASDDFTSDDIRQRVLSGYQYVSSLPEKEAPNLGGHFGGQAHYKPALQATEEETRDEVLENNETLMASVPLIPPEVYEALPPFLARCVLPAANARERDFMLLGALNSCSALMPGVRFLYKRVEYSPHFYLAVVAPAGTGKGAIAFTSALLDATEDYYARLREEQRRRQDEAEAAWQQELNEARRQHRKPDFTRKPREERMQYFKLPATISKSRLIESMAAAGEVGCAMATTEMATLTEAIGTDYGRFEDILLKAFHHEEVSSSYKVDGQPLVARRPRLALAMSGTPEQFAAFFRSLESGLYSRFAVCTRPAAVQWESCAPDAGDTDLHRYFRTLSDEMLGMHTLLLKSPTRVSFTPEQWARHTDFFTRVLAGTHAEGRDAALSVIFRHGLLMMRLAAVLTVFRKVEDYPQAAEYVCTDTDFRSAMLVTQTLLEHSLLLSTSLPDNIRAVSALKKPHRLQAVLGKLPEKFSYKMFIEAADSLGIPLSSAKRILRKAVQSQILDKEDKRYSKTSLSPQGEAYSEPEPENGPESRRTT